MGQGYSRAEVRRRSRNVPASPSTSSDASDSDEGRSRTSRKTLPSSSANSWPTTPSTPSFPERRQTQSTPYQRWLPWEQEERQKGHVSYTQDTSTQSTPHQRWLPWEQEERQKGHVSYTKDTSSWHPNARNSRQRSSTSQLQTDQESVERNFFSEQQRSDGHTEHLGRPQQVVERWLPQCLAGEEDDRLGLLLKDVPQTGELDVQDWERRLRGSEPVTDNDEDGTRNFTDDDEDAKQYPSSLSISPNVSSGHITPEDERVSEKGRLSARRLERNVEQQRGVSIDHDLPESTQRTRETELLNPQRIPETDLRELVRGRSDDEGWSEKNHSLRGLEATTVGGQSRPLEPIRREWQYFLEERRTHGLKERRIMEEELRIKEEAERLAEQRRKQLQRVGKVLTQKALETQRREEDMALRKREEELRYRRLYEERLEAERKRKGEFEEREDMISGQTRELEPRREELRYFPGEQRQLGPGEKHLKEEEIIETERIADQQEKEARLQEEERQELQRQEETLAFYRKEELRHQEHREKERRRRQEEERRRRETERRRELENGEPANPEQTRQLELLRKEAALMERRYLLEEQRKLELEEQRTREEFRSMNEAESRTDKYRKEEQLRKGEDALKEEEMMRQREEALVFQRKLLLKVAKLAQEADFEKQKSLFVQQRQRKAEMRRHMEDELATKEDELSGHTQEVEERKSRRQKGEIVERMRQEGALKKEATTETQQNSLEMEREHEINARRRKHEELNVKVEELKRRTQELAEEQKSREERRRGEEWRLAEQRREAPITASNMHQPPTQATAHTLWRPDSIKMRELALNEDRAVDDEQTVELDAEGVLEHRKEKKSSEDGQTALEQELSSDEPKDEGFRTVEPLEGTPREDSDPLTAVAPEILAELAHLDLSHSIVFKDTRIVGGGTYGDVSTGNCTVSGQRKVKIAIKRLRFWWKKDIKTLFEREIYVWSKLKHPNILPLLGFAVDDSTRFPLMISEWMENGSAWEYVTRNPSCNVMDLVIGIASGLTYLHSLSIVHSDIKSDNIMVSDLGNALICDFGCSRMVDSSRSYARLTSSVKGTSRYLAYELVVAPDLGGEVSGSHTTKTDVWAFGMTAFELFTHERPYANLLDTQVVYAIMKRALPQFPSTFVSSIESSALDGIKSLCNDCWKHDATERPSMQSVLDDLRRICHIDTTQVPA
ncbi:hypothetical protein ACEPAI_9626 [Sanghuangporus weigelae]